MKTRALFGMTCGAIGIALAVPAAAEESQERAERRMKAMDKDADGTVTLEEFTAHRTVWTASRPDVARLMAPRNVKTAFDKLDTNGDGVISFDEMLADAVTAKK